MIKMRYYNKLNNNINNIFSINNNILNINHNRYYSNNINTIKDTDQTDPELIFKELDIDVKDYWVNLDNNNVRLNILEELRYKGGVYIIISKVSKNCYIGSALRNNLYGRMYNHLINSRNDLGSRIVRRSVKKYGLNNIIFGILEYYTVDNENQTGLFELENMYIALISPRYNILREATYKGSKLSDESILNLKKIYSDRRKRLLIKLQLNRNKNPSHSERDNLKDFYSNKLDNKSKKYNVPKYIMLYDNNSNYVCRFDSYNQASHYLCTSHKTIQRSLKLGWIYIPDMIILNDKDIINNVYKLYNDENNIYYLNTRKQISKKKSGLYKYNWNTKYLISNN